MSIIDILVTVIIVTILVTIVLAVVTYIAYKLRLARRPASPSEPGASRYFEVHRPPATADAGALPGVAMAVDEREGGHGATSEAPFPDPSFPGQGYRKGAVPAQASRQVG